MRSLLNIILPFISQTGKRAITPYQTFLLQEKKFLDEQFVITRMSQGYETKGMQQLEHILSFADLEYLLRQPDNYKRYTDHLRFIYDDVILIFDQAQHGTPYYNYYFRSPIKKTKEYILAVSDVNSIVRLPMSAENWEGWRGIKPVRIWAHNSHELTSHLINSYVRFHSRHPSYAIVLIDPIALILKYVMWYKYRRDLEENDYFAEHSPKQMFLHKYVFSNLIYDLGDIWLLNQLNNILAISDPMDLTFFRPENLQDDPQYGYIAGNSARGFEAVWNAVRQMRANGRPEDILNSRLLFSGSIHQRLLRTEKNYELPSLERFDWYRLLRDYDTLMIYLRIWHARRQLTTWNRIALRLRRELEYMQFSRISRYIRHTETRADVEQKIYEIKELIQRS